MNGECGNLLAVLSHFDQVYKFHLIFMINCHLILLWETRFSDERIGFGFSVGFVFKTRKAQNIRTYSVCLSVCPSCLRTVYWSSTRIQGSIYILLTNWNHEYLSNTYVFRGRTLLQNHQSETGSITADIDLLHTRLPGDMLFTFLIMMASVVRSISSFTILDEGQACYDMTVAMPGLTESG